MRSLKRSTGYALCETADTIDQISRPKHQSYDPFWRSQMAEHLCAALINFLPHALVGIVCVPVAAPVESLDNLFLHGVGAGQMPSEIEFSSNTNPFNPKADRFVVADTSPLRGRARSRLAPLSFTNDPI
jgi:hypothetical protein